MECKICSKRSGCKELCPEIEKMLPKERSGGHRKEFSCDPQKLEELATKTAFKLKYGKSYYKGRRGEDNRG
jgi:hypothetical protein